MYLFLLILCVCGIKVNAGNSGDSDDDEKFIDLLPEEEKDAFIDSVARRLISGVRTKDLRYKSNEEVSDEALNQHNEYVRNVLQEESDNLRRHVDKKEDSDTKLNVKGIERSQKQTITEDNKHKQHVDLTLRQGIRRKRNEKESNLDTDSKEFIPVKTVYDDENYKSNTKEALDENSTTEDIQVRGLRRYMKSKTEPPETADSLNDATTIADIESEQNHEDVFADNIEFTTDHEVKNNSNTTDNVVTNHDDFTESVLEEQESENDEDRHLHEFNKAESDTSTTTTITDHVTTTTQNSFIETSTLENLVLNTTNNKENLQASLDNVNLEKVSNSDITEKLKNNSDEKPDTIIVSELNATSKHDVAIEDSVVEPEQTINNKSNEDNSFNTNKTVEQSSFVSDTDNTTTDTPLHNSEIESNTSMSEVNQKDVPDVNKDTENDLQKKSKQTEKTEQFAESKTEKNVQVTEKYNLTKEINSSYVSNKVNQLTSELIVNKTDSNNLENFANRTHNTVLENGNVLTTTEKNYENNANNDSTLPKYEVYYSKLVPNNASDDESTENNLNHTEKAEPNDVKGDNLDFQIAKLVKRTTVLRHGLSQENYLSEEVKQNLQLSSKIKEEYIVYEIPADETPFVQINPEPKEQPYYAPVYNYASNNAYYNAYNRLGPNDEDNDYDLLENVYERYDYNDEDSPDGHRKFKFNNKKPSGKTALKGIERPNHVSLPIVIKTPKFTEIYFNPDEYLDMDYYFERSNRKPELRTRKKRKSKSRMKQYENGENIFPTQKQYENGESIFPTSDDELHPIHSLGHGHIKNHIDAVRQMMYHHKFFGFVPDVTSPKTVSKTTPTGDQRLDHKDHKGDNHDGGDHKGRDDDDDDNDDDDGITFRADNHSDYIILLAKNKRNDYNKRKDVSVDYYFGLYKDDFKGKRYEDFLRASKDAEKEKDNETEANKENSTALSDLIGEIKRRQRSSIDSLRGPKRNPKDPLKDNWKRNAGTIKNLLKINDVQDMLPNLDKLRKMNLTLMRRREENGEVRVFVNVLRDMVKMNNRALEKFDWLGSTVDVLGSLKKLKYLAKHRRTPNAIHPLDLQLLNYVVYLYKMAKSSLEDSEHDDTPLRKTKKNALPKNRKKKKAYLTKTFVNRVWLYRDREDLQPELGGNYLDFVMFLDDLKSSLYDLHNALKHIAMVTKYKNQHWFLNLKSLYLKNKGNKEILVTLLHLFTSRLLELIEESAANGIEDGFLRYVKRNGKQVDRTVEEFVFVLKLMKEIKYLNSLDLK